MKKQMNMTVIDRPFISIDDYTKLMKKDWQMYQINNQYRIAVKPLDIKRLREIYTKASMMSDAQLVIHYLQTLLDMGEYHEPTMVFNNKTINYTEAVSLLKRGITFHQICNEYDFRPTSDEIRSIRSGYDDKLGKLNNQLAVKYQLKMDASKLNNKSTVPSKTTKESEMKNTKRSTSKKAVSSKADAARAIFKKMFGKKNIGRKDIIAAFMKEAKLSKAGASTYYQNIASAQ